MAKLFKLNEELGTDGTPKYRLDEGTFETDNYEVVQTGDFHAPAGFQNIGGIEISPGYRLCVFSDYNQRDRSVNNVCFGEGRHSLPKLSNRWPKNTRSYTLTRHCNHQDNMWHPECHNIDSKKAIYNIESYENKLKYCKSLQPGIGGQDDHCADFCRGKPGVCDTYMTKYCKMQEHQDKGVCKCINSPANIPSENKTASLDGEVLYNPLCIDAECIRDGYATTVMTDNRCQTGVDCGVYHDIKSRNLEMNYIDKDIAQRCSTEAFLKGVTDAKDIEARNVVTPMPNLVKDKVPERQSYLLIKLVLIGVIGTLLFFYRDNAFRFCLSIGSPVCYGIGTGVSLIVIWILTLDH